MSFLKKFSLSFGKKKDVGNTAQCAEEVSNSQCQSKAVPSVEPTPPFKNHRHTTQGARAMPTFPSHDDRDPSAETKPDFKCELEKTVTREEGKTTRTLIIVIFDESGSMDEKKSEVIQSFNSFINEQKQVTDDKARVYFLKFNTVVTPVHKGIPLEKVPPLTNKTYSPNGGTALFDAVAEGINLGNRDKATDEHVICVIITDGEENSSRETTKQQLKDLISRHEASGEWKFLYFGVDPEYWAAELGISSLSAIKYDALELGKNFAIASAKVMSCRVMRK